MVIAIVLRLVSLASFFPLTLRLSAAQTAAIESRGRSLRGAVHFQKI